MSTNTEIQTPEQEEEISLLDLLLVLIRHKKLLWQIPTGFVVLALIYGFVVKPSFEAKTSILPPQQQQSSAAAMLSSLGGLAGGMGASLGLKNPNDLYIAMLQSRAVADQLIARFKLQAYFKAKTLTDTRKFLETATKIASGKDGLISITVEDHSPKLAADLANAYVDELRALSKKLAVTEAAQRRQFFEGQLQKAKQNLADAEIALKQTQQKTGVLQLEAQGKATVEALANLRAQIAARQVQLSAMKNFATEQNPDVQRVRGELDGLQSQLHQLTRGGSDDDVVVSRARLPDVGVEYVRKMRELKYQEVLFELLSKQYELAKMDEAKDGASIQVLDAAIPPERKSKPKRSLLLMLAAVGGFFLACILAFVLEALHKSKENPEGRERWAALKSAWQGK
jgi:uncharacterized protein involved in exopolysaccharide biosynthesis